MNNIQSALISVFDKKGLQPLLEQLNKHQIQIFSTGGTQSYIESQGYRVTAVEDLTEYPSILGGRVKTLHPKVFGGILGRRGTDEEVLDQYQIPAIDLVIVDLYPFEDTLRSGADHQDIIEKIDIGGISLIRAAAKNYKDVLVISDRSQYQGLENILKRGNHSFEEERKSFAAMAFEKSQSYDKLIASYLSEGKSRMELRYGENPHQQAHFEGALDEMFEQLHGKQLSYNNLVDIDAATRIIEDFKHIDSTTFAIIKHTNPCGLATDDDSVQAWKKALAGDPVSAFGGIIACNKPIDLPTAEEINKIFVEVIIAPSYSDEALKVLQSKKNRIILIKKSELQNNSEQKSVLNGLLHQDVDKYVERADDLKPVTSARPEAVEIEDMLYANIIVKHTKSNAIVLAKNRQLLGIGVGQTSRVDALKQAINKADNFDLSIDGAVMASDAFFPFGDSVEIAHKAGIRAVIQPGGSVRDQESIDYCNENNMSMVFTGKRHFKH